MASTTTHSPIDSRSVSSPSSPTTPSATPRPARRTAAWILAGTVTVAAVSIAAGIGYRAYESSQSPAAVVGSDTASRSDVAELAHGSAAQVVTGAGQPVTIAADSAGTLPTSDVAQMAHGSGLTVVTGDGHLLHAEEVQSASVLPPSDDALLAHGTRGSLADASGRVLGATR
jgi:hypothetical protein